MRKLILCLGIAGVGLAVGALAADPSVTCESSKLGTSAKYASCRLKADAKAVKTSETVDYSKCTLDRFTTAETKASSAGGACPTIGDQQTVAVPLLECTTLAARALHEGRFKDNGDGTVTDNKSGLMWEKKTTDVGSGADFSNPHDVDNQYQWCAGTFPTCTNPNNPFDGNAATEFLAVLNGGSTDTCLGGHCDWRLPTVGELEGLPMPLPAEFQPTLSTAYWSSTTSNGWAPNADYVYASGMGTDSNAKTSRYAVRAVRKAN